MVNTYIFFGTFSKGTRNVVVNRMKLLTKLLCSSCDNVYFGQTCAFNTWKPLLQIKKIGNKPN